MRGKDMQRAANVADAGITPAHAGKRRAAHCYTSTAPDHPRPCGEKCLNSFNILPMPGSPPPMRGKDRRTVARRMAGRITPAHAGKSTGDCVVIDNPPDHPRPCGEKLLICVMPIYVRGSPPPMRGKGARIRTAALEARITPAHAGKSSQSTFSCSPSKDHPRPCGEKPP